MGVFDKFSGIGVASGFKLQAKAPIDPRQVVDTIDDRDALITENGAYEGMQVYVKADKKTYLLKDLAAGTWEELGSGGGASELLTIEISVSITETTADVLKTYLNNNADVLAELEAASSFILKVNKQNIATPDTYVFEQNYKDITTGAQHYFICVHAYGKTTTESTILWFSVESGVVKDVTFKSNDLSSGSGTSVQADYNQNDSTASDYIKNRPFYDEAPTIETILDKTFSTIAAGGVNFWATNTSVIQFVKGDIVKVVYNGTEYTQEVKELNAVLYVGNIGLGGLSPATDEPFLVANIYFPDGLSTLTPGTTVATSTAQTNATIKITKEIENVKTIDPKYIKDMYYENVVETELYNGTLTNAKSASGEYYTATLSPYFTLGRNNDKLSVVINGVEKILTVVSYALWEEAGSLAVDGITITDEDKVTINTNEQYTNATIIVTNIHSDVHSIPQKYVNSEEYLIEISVTSISDGDIAFALKKYLNDNPSELNAIRSRTSWVLKTTVPVNDRQIQTAFRWITYRAVSCALFEDEEPLAFVAFSRNYISATDQRTVTTQTTLSIELQDRAVTSISIRSARILDNATWALGVISNINDTDNLNGLLTLLTPVMVNDKSEIFNGAVALHSWITKAQQRSDFQIPTPTKPTDLVDKRYADSLVSGGSSLSIELAVGASENTTDVFKTYLNNNASVLTQLKAASSFNLKVVKTTSVTTITETYVFAKNYTNTFTGVQYHFVCVYGSGQTSTAGSVLWFSLSNDTVNDLKLTTYTFASPTYNHNISITDGSSYSLRFTYPSKSSAIITTQAQLATLIGSEELTASGWALVDGVYYTIGFIKNNSYCYYGNAKAPTWNELGSYTITDSLL